MYMFFVLLEEENEKEFLNLFKTFGIIKEHNKYFIPIKIENKIDHGLLLYI